MPYDLVFYLNRDAITLDRARVVSPTDRRPAGLPSLVVGATLTCALYLIDGDGAAISTSDISPRLLIGSPGYAPPLVELEPDDFTEITDGWEFSLALTTSALIAAMGAETVSQATWLEINTTASSQLRVEYRAAGRLLPALYDPTAVYTTYADLVQAVDAALAAKASAEADATATAADRVQTGLDRDATEADATATAADRVQTGLDRDATEADATATAADRVQTGLDRDATEADATATAADRVQTGLDRDATEADATATAADRVQTGLDRDATEADAAATAADRVQTGLDRDATEADATATAADRVQTGLDRDATEADATATAADRVQTGLDRDATEADAAATAADRVQTGLDRDATEADATATAADRVQTGLDRDATEADATATAADRVQTGLDRSSASASASAAAASATTALNAIADQFKGGLAGASVPATSTLAGDTYRIITPGTATNITGPGSASPALEVGDAVIYEGTSGQWTVLPGYYTGQESITLRSSTPRQVANMPFSDGQTANRAVVWQPGAAGDVAGLPTTFVAHIPRVPTSNPSATSHIITLASSATDLNQANSFKVYLTTAGALIIRAEGATAGTDLRYLTYSGFRDAYSGQPVILVVSFSEGDSTTAPTVLANGQDISSEFTPDTNGTPPNWMDSDLDCTYLLAGYNWPSGAAPRVKYGLGAWTAAEALRHAQTGQEPDWWVSQTGSAVPTGEYDFSSGTDGWSGVVSTVVTGNQDSIGGEDNCLLVEVGGSVANAKINTDIPVEGGYRYRVSGSVYFPSSNAELNGFRFSDDTSSANALGFSNFTNKSSDTWHDFTTEFSVPAGADLITIRIVGMRSASSGSMTIGDKLYIANGLKFTKIGPILRPAINPGDRVAADLGAHNITGLLSSGMSIVGNNREHDEPIKLTVSHSGAGNLQFGGQAVLNTLRANAIDSIIVTSDAAVAWSLGNASGGEQYVSQLAVSASEQYVNPSDIVTYLLTGGALWSKVDGAADITLSIKTRSR